MPHQDAINEQELILVSAFCCVGSYLYFDDCIGCSGKSELCCIEQAWCIKCETECLAIGCCHNDDACCAIGLGCCEIACIPPTTCCKVQKQLCCIVTQGAFPCDDEVPVACAVCGLACLPGCGCCQTLESLTGGDGYRRAP